MATPFALTDAFILAGGAGNQNAASVAALSDGRVFVTFEDSISGGINRAVAYPSIETGENAEPSAFVVGEIFAGSTVSNASVVAGPYRGVAMAYQDSNGNVAVRVFHDTSNTASSFSSSSLRSPEGSQVAGTNADVRVAINHEGLAAVAWSNGANFEFRFYQSEADGEFAFTGSSVFTHSNGFGVDTQTEIAALRNGNFVIAGRDANNSGDPVFYVVDSVGGLVATGRASTLAATEQNTSVAALADGGFVLVWQSSGGDSGGGSIQMEVFDANGTSRSGGADTLVNTTQAGLQDQATVLALPDGRFVVAWRDAAENGNIRARIFNGDGSPDSDDFLVAGGASFQARPAIALTHDGRLLFTWEDNVGGDADILGRIFEVRETGATIVGRETYDFYVGSAFGDRVHGLGGRDTIYGGLGDDILDGGDGDDILDGQGGSDVLIGGSGDDTLRGGHGYDHLEGGDGNDVYEVMSSFGEITIIESADGGAADEVRSALVDLNTSNVRISGNVERIVLTGSLDLDISFLTTFLDLTFIGNAGTNNISGGFGDDRILGGNTFGDGEANLLRGASGDDIVGGTGITSQLLQGGRDFMREDGGNDIYIVDNPSDSVDNPASSSGIDTIRTTNVSIDLALAQWGMHSVDASNAIENAVVLGIAANNASLSGNGLANTLDGSQNTGSNALAGRGGNDTYIIGAGDTVSEAGGGGMDLVRSLVTHTMAADIEWLTLIGGAAISGTGNALANTITGNAGRNTLDGGIGNDRLDGGIGNDVLIGGVGRDTLTGGIGNDTFKFTNKTHSRGSTMDTITDFDDRGRGNDRIDVSALFGPRMRTRRSRRPDRCVSRISPGLT